MSLPAPDWDYLVVTASNEAQAGAYRAQLETRRRLGFLSGVRRVLVVPDPGGRRVGSGGSTLVSLLEVLGRELRGARGARRLDRAAWEETLGRLRILIVHAGGDSKRLPPYGPCGKIFVPVPGEAEAGVGPTIFDRQLPRYLELPALPGGRGQTVVTTGDVLLVFDADKARFEPEGITGLGCPADPRVARNHGVYGPDRDGRVRLFLQKPTVEDQAGLGVVDAHGRTVLDIGIINFDAASAVRLLRLTGARLEGEGLAWTGPLAEAAGRHGLDLYREICCAMGSAATFPGYLAEVRRAGSTLPEARLAAVFRGLAGAPFRVSVVPRCGFYHFGTLRELVETGQNLLALDTGISHAGACLAVDTHVADAAGGSLAGRNAWVEACRIAAPVRLAGGNVMTGVDVAGGPLDLPEGACLDVLEGRGRDEGKAAGATRSAGPARRRGFFVRVYGIDDAFHLAAGKGGRLAGRPVLEWLAAAGATPGEAWDDAVAEPERTVWNGKFFPLVRDAAAWRDWLWMADPAGASAAEKRAWRAADRYSFEEMARLASQEAFHRRRLKARAVDVRRSFPRLFRAESDFSAAELALLWRGTDRPESAAWVVEALVEAHGRFDGEPASAGRPSLEDLELPRLLHTLGSALLAAGEGNDRFGAEIAAAVGSGLNPGVRAWLAGLGAPAPGAGRAAAGRGAAKTTREKTPAAAGPAAGTRRWAAELREAAFGRLGRLIVTSGGRNAEAPRNALRSDEIVWGRAPARLDLGGGWTDTPPYALERGGCVINAAADLNGQAPIQAYARVIPEREIRILSIDHGEREVIRGLDELLNFREPAGKFALAKAALAQSGFGAGAPSLDRALRRFGGGIELTTLAAIPSGSGLGTSSIMGAVLLSVVGRMQGRRLTRRELFHGVLQLEQALTTGGGWQDQVGGVLEGVKLITADPGLVPDPFIQYVPADLLDPGANGGTTLLYYTGLRRLAKNILHEVVGRYLDRDRAAMETLRRLRAFPPLMAEALARRDAMGFGALLDYAWRLNVDLDPHHTNEDIEALRDRVARRVAGAKLLGAGGGGFLLLACRSAEDAAALRADLEAAPPNAKARFFDFAVNRSGLVVTVC